jgi:excisionase family DNA binding protein
MVSYSRLLILPNTGAGLRRVLRIIPDPITLEEAAVLLKVTSVRVRQCIKSNGLGAVRWGREYLLSRDAVLAFGKLPRRRGRPRKRTPDDQKKLRL